MMDPDFFSCPYPECTGLTPISAGSILFCAECDAAVIFCDSCNIANRAWARFCRACGASISSRRDIMGRDDQGFIETWARSRGLFLERAIPGGSADGWRGRLVGIDGSCLVFGGRGSLLYSDVFLAHPDRRQNALPNLMATEAAPPALSGAAVTTDGGLFLGSDNALIQIDLSAISSAIPYRLDLHRRGHQTKCQSLAFLDQGHLLLGERSDDGRIRFKIWDLAGNIGDGAIDVDALSFSVSRGRLFVASAERVESYLLNLSASRFEPIGSLPLDGLFPRSRPFPVNDALYLVVSDDAGGLNRALLKWEMDDQETGRMSKRITHSGFINDFVPIGAKYAILEPNGVSIYDSAQDQSLRHFARDIHTALGLGSFGRLLALPVANSPSSFCVEVVAVDSGRSIFTTDPFSEILPDIVVWSRHLFVLGRREGDREVKLYGYDLQGERQREDDR